MFVFNYYLLKFKEHRVSVFFMEPIGYGQNILKLIEVSRQVNTVGKWQAGVQYGTEEENGA